MTIRSQDEGERGVAAHAANNVRHHPKAATAGSALIVARRAQTPESSGYAARRGTLLTSTFREACHAS